MKTINGLPVYEDVIGDEGCGMLRISLVDFPAVESDFQKFGTPVKVRMESEERRLILGVVMRADFPIYRCDPVWGEYYTMFSRETIRQMAEKYLVEGRQNRVNLMHCGEEVRGVQMVQLFIKDSARGIIPAGFEDIEDGSLFAEFHVEDDEIWAWVKEGILRGFSLEGFFDMQEQFSKDMGIDTKKWKRKLAAILAKFTEVTTDKGVLTYEGDLEEGKDIYLINEEGEVVDAPNGEYTLEDGTLIVIEGGKIASITPAAADTTTTSSPSTDEGEAENVAEALAAEDETEVADDVDIHNLAAEVERLKEENEQKKKEITDLLARVEALEKKSGETEEALRKMSAAAPAHEEVKGSYKSDTDKYLTDHQKFLSGIAGSIRK